MMTGDKHYDRSINDILQRSYLEFNGEKFNNNHIDGILYAHNIELEWQEEKALIQGIPIYAKPAWGENVRAKLCIGEIIVDEYGKRHFWRWNGKGGITSVCGITYIIPYGMSINDYIIEQKYAINCK